MSDRVLVTGGAGFIGSHVVDQLVEMGAEVVVLDRLDPAAHDGEPDYLNPAASYVWGDLLDEDVLARCLAGVTAVSHQAARVGLGLGFGDVADYVWSNDGGTAVLLRALHASGFRGRLVLAGSMVVYGEGRYRCREDGAIRSPPRDRAALADGRFNPRCPRCRRELIPEAVTEDDPVDPRNVYAATKLHQEHLCATFGREVGVPVTALRYHNVYGPRMPRDTPYAGVAARFRSALESGRPATVFEDGRQLRDFVHVRDVARANVLALTADVAATGPLNVASGRPHTVGEMAEALTGAFGEGAPRPVVTGEFRLGDVRHVFAATDRAAGAIGFRAEIGFERGMAEFAVAPLRAPSASYVSGKSTPPRA